MKEEYGVELDENKIYKSLKMAREAVEGNAREQYAKLWDYAHALLHKNPNSTIKIDTIPQPEGPPIFQRLYIYFDGCKKGFVNGCRPLIGLDGCFLKGFFGGQILAAIGKDVENQIFVIAYAIVDSETKENWKWFVELLHQDLGDYQIRGWEFVSDMQKGIKYALQKVMPRVPHRFCDAPMEEL